MGAAPTGRKADPQVSETAFKYSSVKKRRIEWLWHPFIQKGAINLLTGGPGTGKSTIACDIAAALSRGRPLPGESPAIAQARGIHKTWLFNAEDDPEDTIIWRLCNQDADLDKIYGRPISGPINFDIIKEMKAFILKESISLVVVDPVQAWIPADTDMHRANQMREWGNLFRTLCQETGCTVIWVRHRRKGDADDAGSINSGLGSIDMSGIVRSEIGAVATKKGSKIVRIKGSVGQTGLELSYSIEPTGEPNNDHGQLHWSGSISKVQPTEKVGRAKPNPEATWLIGLLSDGPRPVQSIMEAGKRLGYSESTLYRRANDLTVSFNEGKTGYWRLRTPADDFEQPSDTVEATDI